MKLTKKEKMMFSFAFSLAILFVIGLLSSTTPTVHAQSTTECQYRGDGPVAVEGTGRSCSVGGANTNYQCPDIIGYFLGFIGSGVTPLTPDVIDAIEGASISRCDQDLDSKLAQKYAECAIKCADGDGDGQPDPAPGSGATYCGPNPQINRGVCVANCQSLGGLGVGAHGVGTGFTNYYCKAKGTAIFQCDCYELSSTGGGI